MVGHHLNVRNADITDFTRDDSHFGQVCQAYSRESQPGLQPACRLDAAIEHTSAADSQDSDSQVDGYRHDLFDKCKSALV